uniref:Uncharacterized protein n=1 Tax=Aegilops tauschii subsp. strangulata TaxID=200361 RepID=A0A453LAP8_AEGTS
SPHPFHAGPAPQRAEPRKPRRRRRVPDNHLCPSVAGRGETPALYEPGSHTRIQRGTASPPGSPSPPPPNQLRRLNLGSSSQLAVSHPKVDEISLLAVSTTTVHRRQPRKRSPSSP